MSVQSYQELEVWKKAMDLVVACYRTSEGFPKSEAYGLVTQLQRAAVSVPANIAEGQGRNHTKEFINHLSIAYGSLMEIETHLQIAERLGYIEQALLRGAPCSNRRDRTNAQWRDALPKPKADHRSLITDH